MKVRVKKYAPTDSGTVVKNRKINHFCSEYALMFSTDNKINCAAKIRTYYTGRVCYAVSWLYYPVAGYYGGSGGSSHSYDETQAVYDSLLFAGVTFDSYKGGEYGIFSALEAIAEYLRFDSYYIHHVTP
jgi:hypothetical protein